MFAYPHGVADDYDEHPHAARSGEWVARPHRPVRPRSRKAPPRKDLDLVAVRSSAVVVGSDVVALRARIEEARAAAVALNAREHTDALDHLPPLSERAAWIVLVVLGLVAGALTGLAFADKGFFLKGPTAVLLCLGVLGLMSTLIVWSRDRRQQLAREEDHH
jgi:hypothetical protein